MRLKFLTFVLLALSLLALGASGESSYQRGEQAGESGPLPTRVEVKSAPVALFHSPATRRNLGWRWDWEWKGAEHVLQSLGVEYEVVGPKELNGWNGRILVLPNVRNMSRETVKLIESKEVKVLATYMTSYRDRSNEPWEGNNLALSSVLRVDFLTWVGGGEAAGRMLLGKSLGGRTLTLGRGQAMLVEPGSKATVLASWPGGEAAVVETEGGIFVGEDLFCPENSDSRPVMLLLSRLLNRLEPGIARSNPRSTFSALPRPPLESVKRSGETVRVGLGTLEEEALIRASGRLSVNGRLGLKFHRWTRGQTLVVKGEPYLELLRLRENGTYRWTAYRGTLEIDGEGNTVNTLDLEEYLAGVVPSEVPAVFPQESLKAMAVVARTYAASHLSRHQGFDVCDSYHCQVYGGVGQEAPSTTRAVSQTTGQTLTFDGRPVNALFHAVCGGKTAAASEAWPGGAGAPYLCSRDDEGYCAHSGRYHWELKYSREELAETLRRSLQKMEGQRFEGLSELTALRIEERSQSGRVARLRVESPEGTCTVEGDSIRWLFSGGRISTSGLQSTLFDLEETADGFVIKGGGWGHGVGMCQQGASGRARAGQNYQEILEYYYPRTSLAIAGEESRVAGASVGR